jgi:hypothetical protein
MRASCSLYMQVDTYIHAYTHAFMHMSYNLFTHLRDSLTRPVSTLAGSVNAMVGEIEDDSDDDASVSTVSSGDEAGTVLTEADACLHLVEPIVRATHVPVVHVPAVNMTGASSKLRQRKLTTRRAATSSSAVSRPTGTVQRINACDVNHDGSLIAVAITGVDSVVRVIHAVSMKVRCLRCLPGVFLCEVLGHTLLTVSQSFSAHRHLV